MHVNFLSVSAGRMALSVPAVRQRSLRVSLKNFCTARIVITSLPLPPAPSSMIPISLMKWFTTTFLICESRKGMSANQIKRTMGISYKTAWYLCHRIRKAMASERTSRCWTERLKLTKPMLVASFAAVQWTGKNNKEIVIGIRQRGGDLRFFHAEDCKSGTLAKYIKENVSDRC